MYKVAIFVEGQTEQIFVKELLYQLFGYQSVRIRVEKKRGKNIFVSIKDDDPNEPLNYEFLLIDVGNDEKVTSFVVENAVNMINNGYQKIFGLRDLYPNSREQEDAVRKRIEKIIQNRSQPDKVNIFLAIMETEAWFLADPNLFQKIHPKLTIEYIQSELEIDLENIDSQVFFDHPTRIIKDIYQLAESLVFPKSGLKKG